MEKDALSDAITVLDDSVRDRIRRITNGEGPPPPHQELSRVILEVAALCGRLRLEYLGSEKLIFILADQETKDYTLPSPSRAHGLLRSVLARLAFIVNDILHEEIPEVELELSPPEMKGLSVEEQKRKAVDFVHAVMQANEPRDREINARKLPSANPYGFSLDVDYITAEGRKIPLHIETSNTLGKPCYFDVRVI